MNRTLARNILRTITHFRGQPLWDALGFLEESQWWDHKMIVKFQEEKLSMLIQHCSQNVPFYRKWFKEKGYKPSDVGLQNLTLLPTISKSFLRQNLDQFTADNYNGAVEQAKTSGSTGIPLHFPKSLTSSALQLGAMYRGHRWHGVEPGAKEARLWGVHVNKLSRYQMILKDILLNRFRESEYNLQPKTLNSFTQKIKRSKPEYLMGYTSMVTQYANFLESNGYNGKEFRLKMVKCTSEGIRDKDREIVESVFGCPLVSEYGAAETGLISFQCESGSDHLMEDCCVVEFIRPEEMIKDSNLKEVVVTNLDNYAMPILRYRVGDYAVPSSKTCSCGRKLQLVDSIVGRVSDIIKTSDGRRWHSIILYYIMKGLDEKFGGVLQFKVFQKQMDKLEFLIIPEKKLSDEALQYLHRKCMDHFGELMEIDLQIVESIPREKSGKLRDFVSFL